MKRKEKESWLRSQLTRWPWQSKALFQKTISFRVTTNFLMCTLCPWILWPSEYFSLFVLVSVSLSSLAAVIYWLCWGIPVSHQFLKIVTLSRKLEWGQARFFTSCFYMLFGNACISGNVCQLAGPCVAAAAAGRERYRFCQRLLLSLKRGTKWMSYHRGLCICLCLD